MEKVSTELHRIEGLVIRLKGTLAVHDIGQAGDGAKVFRICLGVVEQRNTFDDFSV